METSSNIEAIDSLLSVESYLGLLMDVAIRQELGTDGSDEVLEGEQMARLHERLTRRQVD